MGNNYSFIYMEDIKTVGVGVLGMLTQFIEIASPILTFLIGVCSLVYVVLKGKLTLINYRNAKQKKENI